MKKYKSFWEFLKRHKDLGKTMLFHISFSILMIFGGIASFNVMNIIVFIVWTSFFTLLIPLAIYRIWRIYKICQSL